MSAGLFPLHGTASSVQVTGVHGVHCVHGVHVWRRSRGDAATRRPGRAIVDAVAVSIHLHQRHTGGAYQETSLMCSKKLGLAGF